MATFFGDRIAELNAEKALLVKAEKDIEEGWRRFRNQQDLLMGLRAAGHETRQAEHLLELFEQSLVEWERHRVLIEERVAYLER
jgi:hypothetical protein